MCSGFSAPKSLRKVLEKSKPRKSTNQLEFNETWNFPLTVQLALHSFTQRLKLRPTKRKVHSDFQKVKIKPQVHRVECGSGAKLTP